MSELSKTLSSDSILILRDGAYYVALFDEGREFDKDHAYLDGDYFYLYRGKKSKYDMVKPGIYKDADSGKIVKVDPVTDEEKDYYLSEGKIVSHDPIEAARLINEHDDLFVPISENCKLFNPEITVNDDILKRILKMLFIEKEIDIDNYKDRFPDKNALFNFKQVMKNDSARVTMKIFERACDVVNVEYEITIREKNNGCIGKKMEKDLTVSSEDTYEFGTVATSSESDEENTDM